MRSRSLALLLLSIAGGCAPSADTDVAHKSDAVTSTRMKARAIANGCVVAEDGRVFCWKPGGIPTPKAGISDVSDLSLGDGHTCAVTSHGDVSCWGENTWGELGNGTTTSSLTPTHVSGLPPARAVVVGRSYSCALTNAGKVWCWGMSGNVGTVGLHDSQSTPLEISTLSEVQAIAGGDYHACALDTAGAVRCWGSNEYGGVDPTRLPVIVCTPSAC
jgi:alpha-tubulin suppressor-like RCC1 family protein